MHVHTTVGTSLSVVGGVRDVDLLRCQSETSGPVDKPPTLPELDLQLKILTRLFPSRLREVHAHSSKKHQGGLQVVSRVRRHRYTLDCRLQREDDQLTVG